MDLFCTVFFLSCVSPLKAKRGGSAYIFTSMKLILRIALTRRNKRQMTTRVTEGTRRMRHEPRDAHACVYSPH